MSDKPMRSLPLKLHSTTLLDFIQGLDLKFVEMEDDLNALYQDLQKEREKNSKEIYRQVDASGKQMADGLKAILSTPPIESIGVPAAVVLHKILLMNDATEIHKYIRSIAEGDTDVKKLYLYLR